MKSIFIAALLLLLGSVTKIGGGFVTLHRSQALQNMRNSLQKDFGPFVKDFNGENLKMKLFLKEIKCLMNLRRREDCDSEDTPLHYNYLW